MQLDHGSSGPELTELLTVVVCNLKVEPPNGRASDFGSSPWSATDPLPVAVELEPRNVLFRPNFYPLFSAVTATHAMQSDAKVKYNGPEFASKKKRQQKTWRIDSRR
jgi:hypothetical protein